jgi:hypothetical protein
VTADRRLAAVRGAYAVAAFCRRPSGCQYGAALLAPTRDDESAERALNVRPSRRRPLRRHSWLSFDALAADCLLGSGTAALRRPNPVVADEACACTKQLYPLLEPDHGVSIRTSRLPIASARSS